MRSTSLLAALSAAPLIVGCGGDSLTVDPVKARGSVGGLVLDAETRLPLAGVSVDILAGGESFEPVVTEADGRFSFDAVPAGEFLVNFSGPDGYQAAWARDEIPTSAGEFPTGNAAVTVGPIGLVQGDQTLRVRILDQQGRPVNNYEFLMRSFTQYLDFTGGRGVSAGEILSAATTDVEGYARFEGVPDFYRLGPEADDTLEFVLPPLDTDQNGVNEFPGGQQVFRVRSQEEPSLSIILDTQYNTALEIRNSSLAALIDATAPPLVIAVNQSLSVLFNLPIDSGVVVNVTDEDGQPLSIAPDVSARDESLSISFAAQPLTPGQEYNLSLRVTSSLGGSVLSAEFGAPFFTSGEAPLSAEATELANGDIELAFSEPVGVGGGAAPVIGAGDCVLFVNEDLDASGEIGDAVNELGAEECDLALSSAESDPDGPAGLSGYTSYWRFTPPTLADGNPLPAETEFHVLLTKLGDDAEIEFPDGDLPSDVIVDGFTVEAAAR